MRKLMITILMMGSLAAGLHAADWKNLSNFASVTAIVQRGGDLWVAGRGGVVIIDTATQQKTYFKKTAGQLPTLMVEDMLYSATTGTTWIGTYDNGLVRVNSGMQFQTYPFADSTLRLYRMALGASGVIWCATSDGLYKFQSGVYTKITAVNLTNAWDLKMFPDGRLLLGSNQPVIYDPVSNTVYEQMTNVFAYNTSHVEVKDDSSYYFATDHGGLVYVHDTMAYDISDTTVSGFSNEVQQLKYIGNNKVLLLGAQNYKAYQYDGNSWTPYTHMAEIEEAKATYIYQKNSGEILAGGIGGGGMIKAMGGASISIQRFGIFSNIINVVREKSEHEVWIMGGTQIGLYDIATASFEHVDTLPGEVWSSHGDILDWNGTTLAFGFSHLYQWTGSAWVQLTIPGLPAVNVNILSAATDTSGRLYLGTYYGVYVVQGTTVTHYDATNTPVLNNNDLIRDIHFDALRNTVWMASVHGIVKLVNNTFSIIDENNTPALTNYTYINTITQDAAGTMWFGTAYGGLITYDGSDYSLELLPGTAGNQTVNGIAFDGTAMYVVDNVYGFWIRENGTWTNYNMRNCDMTSTNITSVYADYRHNVWLTSTDYGSNNGFGIDIYNKDAVALSVKDIAANKISVYPNPASAIVTIADPQAKDGSVILLTDALGRNYPFTLMSQHIDISSLAAGMYILDTRSGAAAVRIIRQ